jgi:hypothetical protein
LRCSFFISHCHLFLSLVIFSSIPLRSKNLTLHLLFGVAKQSLASLLYFLFRITCRHTNNSGKMFSYDK